MDMQTTYPIKISTGKPIKLKTTLWTPKSHIKLVSNIRGLTRLFEFEAENTKLLRENQAFLQQVNDLTNQLHKDHESLMCLTEDLSKYKSAAEIAEKIMDDTLKIIKECRWRQDVAEEE